MLSAYGGKEYAPNPLLQKYANDRRVNGRVVPDNVPSAPAPTASTTGNSLVGGTPITLQGEAGAELTRLRKEFAEDSVATSLSAKAQRARDSARGKK